MITKEEQIRLAEYHIANGGACARCDLPAVKIINGLAYCGDECEERISDFGLEDAEMRQHGVCWMDDDEVSEKSLQLLLKEFRDVAYKHTGYGCAGSGFEELIERADNLIGSAKE